MTARMRALQFAVQLMHQGNVGPPHVQRCKGEVGRTRSTLLRRVEVTWLGAWWIGVSEQAASVNPLFPTTTT